MYWLFNKSSINLYAHEYAMPVSLGQKCLHVTFYLYLGREFNPCKYEKLPNVVTHACLNISEKLTLLEMCGPHIRLCLFTFRPIASKQFWVILQEFPNSCPQT